MPECPELPGDKLSITEFGEYTVFEGRGKHEWILIETLDTQPLPEAE